MKPVLGIFVKEPVAGRVKTRLSPPLSAEQAAGLYRVALHETIERMQAGPFAVVLFHAGAADFFRAAFPELPCVRQSDGDLGARMTAALDHLHRTGADVAALIGSDSPDLPIAQITAAFSSLAEVDLVTVPAADGGYVLIGSRRSLPAAFADIDWSTDRVLEQTRQRVADAGIGYREIGGWEDVDDLTSLVRLLERSPQSQTARYAGHHLAELLAKIDNATAVGR